MKKFLFGVISTVMVSGLLLGSMGSDVFATEAKDNPGKAKGCDNANNEKMKTKNPHCEVVNPCTDPITWYFDFDHDGYGGISTESSCTQPDGFVALGGDCDDGDADIYPGNGC